MEFEVTHTLYLIFYKRLTCSDVFLIFMLVLLMRMKYPLQRSETIITTKKPTKRPNVKS